MSPITQRDVRAHQAAVPWPNLRQVEQDLLVCRSMAALFNDEFLKSQVAMRGGTLLHKAHLAPASRYSEDIDLVVYGDRPEGHVNRAIRRVLEPYLGNPVHSRWENLKVARPPEQNSSGFWTGISPTRDSAATWRRCCE